VKLKIKVLKLLQRRRQDAQDLRWTQNQVALTIEEQHSGEGA
jgi:hypothetical protein